MLGRNVRNIVGNYDKRRRNMTKKAFEDWRMKQSYTKHIELFKSSSEYEENGILYFFDSDRLFVDTLEFEDDGVTIMANTNYYYLYGEPKYGSEIRKVRIPRTSIKSVNFQIVDSCAIL